MKLSTRFMLALALLLGRFSGYGRCANRMWCKGKTSEHEIEVTYRRFAEPDGYSREELVRMLHIVRKHQNAQGWTDYQRYAAEPGPPETLMTEVEFRRQVRSITRGRDDQNG